MGVTNPINFEKNTVISAGGKGLVVQVNHLIYFVKGGICPGPVDSDAPSGVVFAVPGGNNFPANFNQVVLIAPAAKQGGNLIDTVTFGNGRQINGDGGPFFHQKSGIHSIDICKADIRQKSGNLTFLWNLILAAATPEAPEIHQGVYGTVPGPIGKLMNLLAGPHHLKKIIGNFKFLPDFFKAVKTADLAVLLIGGHAPVDFLQPFINLFL